MNSERKGQLDIPPASLDDADAVEIARIWVTHGKLEVCLRPEIWEEPATWGIMLADLARHVANAYEQLEERDIDEVLALIKLGFDAEWESPTDEVEGEVLDS